MSEKRRSRTDEPGEWSAEAAARVQLFAAIADLKLRQYQLMVTIHALVDALERRGLVGRADVLDLARRADRRAARRALTPRRRPDAATPRAPL